MVVMIDFLRKLGLNKYEALAYMALLSEESLSAYKLSDKSKVPFGRIYDSLRILENKGLIEVIPGKPKKYLVRNPKNSINVLLDEKNNKIEMLRNEIDSFSNKFKKNKKSNYEITVMQGRPNFVKCVVEHFDYDKEFYATSEEFRLEKWFPSIHRYATKSANTRFVLIDKNKANMKRINELKNFGINFKHYVLENVRILVSDESLVTISINENKEIKTIHTKSKILGKAITKILKHIYSNAQDI
jgi:sugar-specific transcriptional regulator TrmB